MTDQVPASIESLASPLLIQGKAIQSKAVAVTERFVWTFVEAGIGSLPATVALTGHNLAAVGYSALTAGIAAVIALAKNLTLLPQS